MAALLAHDTPAPPAHPRRVLLCVTGLSPQVVTETVYALAVQARPIWVPTEIHLVTTARGADNARLKLLSESPGWFHRLCRDYRLDGIAFPPAHVHAIARPDGSPLEDIRDDADNRLAADFIAETVRGLTMNADCEVHASIAGGRKTMGFYLGYAMSLFGRAQDRLSHVLVSAPFESHPEFYYPTPGTRVIHTLDRAQDALDTSRARVWLGDIPFVRLRHGLPAALVAGHADFGGAVHAAQRRFDPPELRIDLENRRVRAGGEDFRLAPVELACLAWFARRVQDGRGPVEGLGERDPDGRGAAYRDEFLREYYRIDPLADAGRVAQRLRHGMLRSWFDERRAKLNHALRAKLGARAQVYLVHGRGRRPCCYALDLTPEAVHFGSLP